MCSGEGIPSIPARPTRVAAAAKVFSCLLKARGLRLAFLWWRFRNYFFFPLACQLLDQRSPAGCLVPWPWVPAGAGRCAHEGVRTRGSTKVFLHQRLAQNTVGCVTSPPRAGLTCGNRASSASALPPGIAILSHLWSFQTYINVFISFRENWGQTYFIP